MSTSAAIAKISPVHRQLAEWLIAHGTKKGWNKKAAEHFGFSQPHISIIYHSDAFQDYYHNLATAHSNAVVVGLADKVNGLAGQAIDELAERLSSQDLPINQVLDIAELALKRTGLGTASPNGTQVQVNVVSPDVLAEARKGMRLEKPIDITPVEGASEKGAS